LAYAYSVEEDVMLSNLLIRTVTSLCLSQIPTGDILLGKTSLEEQVTGTGSTSTKGTQDKGSGLTAKLLLPLCDVLADLLNEFILVQVVAPAIRECRHRRELLAGVSELPGPSLETESSTGETSVIAKCANAPLVFIE
jgi:hypothetical protein